MKDDKICALTPPIDGRKQREQFWVRTCGERMDLKLVSFKPGGMYVFLRASHEAAGLPRAPEGHREAPEGRRGGFVAGPFGDAHATPLTEEISKTDSEHKADSGAGRMDSQRAAGQGHAKAHHEAHRAPYGRPRAP